MSNNFRNHYPCGHRESSSGMVCEESDGSILREKKIVIHRALLALVEDEIELSVRAANCLKHENIRLVGDLVQKREADLMKIKALGKKTIREMNDALSGIIKLLTEMNRESIRMKYTDGRLVFSPWNKSKKWDSEFLWIMRAQQSRGGFLLDGAVSDFIGVSAAQMKGLAGRMAIKGNGDKERILSTAIVIKFMEKQPAFSGRYYFDAVFRQHREWMEHATRRYSPSIDGERLDTWVNERVFLS